MEDNLEWELRKMILGGSISQFISLISELKIADYLDECAKNMDEFVFQNKEINTGKIERIMRIGIELGLFLNTQEGKYKLTKMGMLLRSNEQGTLRDYALFKGSNWAREALKGLVNSISSEKCAFEIRHKENLFEFIDNSGVSENYHNSISNISYFHDDVILKNYDFSNFDTVMDIGAGTGSLLSRILNNYPEIKGFHFDQVSATDMSKNSFLADRNLNCEFEYGDFFKNISKECDLYILKTILHDWNDKKAGEIINNIRKVIPKNGKLLVIEILPQANGSFKHSLMDLEMLIYYGGKERSLVEYTDLISKFGFQLVSIKNTDSSISLMEFEPI